MPVRIAAAMPRLIGWRTPRTNGWAACSMRCQVASRLPSSTAMARSWNGPPRLDGRQPLEQRQHVVGLVEHGQDHGGDERRRGHRRTSSASLFASWTMVAPPRLPIRPWAHTILPAQSASALSAERSVGTNTGRPVGSGNDWPRSSAQACGQDRWRPGARGRRDPARSARRRRGPGVVPPDGAVAGRRRHRRRDGRRRLLYPAGRDQPIRGVGGLAGTDAGRCFACSLPAAGIRSTAPAPQT